MTWKKTFLQFDKDSSGYIDVSELKSVFNSIGETMFNDATIVLTQLRAIPVRIPVQLTAIRSV